MALSAALTRTARVGDPRQPRTALIGADDVYWLRRWGLVEHWRLDEVSGAALPAYGANTLTDNATVTSNPGKISPLARQFTAANSEYFSIVDNAGLSIGDIDFWWSVWVWFDSKPGAGPVWGIVDKGDNNSPFETEYSLRYNNNGSVDRFDFSILHSTVQKTVTANTFGGPSTSAWYFVMAYHDSINDLLGISVNGGAFDTAATAATAPGDTALPVTVGARNGGVATTFWDGRIQALSFGKNPPGGIAGLRSEIRDRLYNGGDGRLFPWR